MWEWPLGVHVGVVSRGACGHGPGVHVGVVLGVHVGVAPRGARGRGP